MKVLCYMPLFALCFFPMACEGTANEEDRDGRELFSPGDDTALLTPILKSIDNQSKAAWRLDTSYPFAQTVLNLWWKGRIDVDKRESFKVGARFDKDGKPMQIVPIKNDGTADSSRPIIFVSNKLANCDVSDFDHVSNFDSALLPRTEMQNIWTDRCSDISDSPATRDQLCKNQFGNTARNTIFRKGRCTSRVKFPSFRREQQIELQCQVSRRFNRWIKVAYSLNTAALDRSTGCMLADNSTFFNFFSQTFKVGDLNLALVINQIGVGSDAIYGIEVDNAEIQGKFLKIIHKALRLLEEVADLLFAAIDALLEGLKNKHLIIKNQFSGNKFNGVQARAVNKTTSFSDLPEEEKSYINRRLELARVKLEQLFPDLAPIDISEVPRVAIVGSGGGYRAMVSTMGVVGGIHDSGLLDTVEYISALSGSSWFVLPWMVDIESNNWDSFRARFTSRIVENGNILGFNRDQTRFVATSFMDSIAVRDTYDLPITGITPFKHTLGAALLESDKRRATIDAIEHKFDFNAPAALPYPIVTFVEVGTINSRSWGEITPHEIMIYNNGVAIKPWAFQRKFKNGISDEFAPPPMLTQIMGIAGSAFTVTAAEAIEQLSLDFGVATPFLKRIFDNVINVISRTADKILNLLLSNSRTLKADNRIAASELPNFSFGVTDSKIENIDIKTASIDGEQGFNMKNIFKKEDDLTYVDAGLDFGIPVPPFIDRDRKIDIMLIVDASGIPLKDGVNASRYARRRSLAFPNLTLDEFNITLTSIERSAGQLLRQQSFNYIDGGSLNPHLFFFSLIEDKQCNPGFDPTDCKKLSKIIDGYCSTFNFDLNATQINTLSAFTECVSKKGMSQYKDVLREVILRKRTPKINFFPDADLTFNIKIESIDGCLLAYSENEGWVGIRPCSENSARFRNENGKLRIISGAGDQSLDSCMVYVKDSLLPIQIEPCNNNNPNSLFSLSESGQIIIKGRDDNGNCLNNENGIFTGAVDCNLAKEQYTLILEPHFDNGQPLGRFAMAIHAPFSQSNKHQCLTDYIPGGRWTLSDCNKDTSLLLESDDSGVLKIAKQNQNEEGCLQAVVGHLWPTTCRNIRDELFTMTPTGGLQELRTKRCLIYRGDSNWSLGSCDQNQYSISLVPESELPQ